MTERTVFVTGAGGAAGVSVIRALRAAGHRTIGADTDPLAAGIHLADEGVVLPPFSSEGFLDTLCSEADRRGASVLISTLAEEMVTLSSSSQHLREAGLAHWLPDPEAVLDCIDKWRFAQVLAKTDLPAAATGLGDASGVPGPWIVKPRFGRGSRDVYRVDDENELEWALRRVSEPLVQTRLDGREFTIDALVDRDGSLAGAVPRWRIETKAGISTKGETFEHAGLVEATAALLDTLGLRGPANVQGFVSESGEAAFMEVNPRFSGALPLSLAAGADLVGEYLRAILGGDIRRDRLAFSAGVIMVRHFEEIFLGPRP